MKYNRKLLEEETLQKIKEVNDEAGYRSYLEVPEMVNIIASIIEERIQTLYDVRDAQSQQIANLTAYINKIDREDHNMKSIQLLSSEVEKLSSKLRDWKKCADRLFVYAMETLSTATNMALYEVAKEDVLEYNRLKNGNE